MMIHSALAIAGLALCPAIATQCHEPAKQAPTPTVWEIDECSTAQFDASPPDTITVLLLTAETDCFGNPATHQLRCDNMGGTLRADNRLRFCDNIDY